MARDLFIPDSKFPDGTRSVIGRYTSAFVRAELGVMRSSGAQLARAIGRSQNYVATRLRDAAPFTLDDVELIADALGYSGAEEFITIAHSQQAELVWGELEVGGVPYDNLDRGPDDE